VRAGTVEVEQALHVEARPSTYGPSGTSAQAGPTTVRSPLGDLGASGCACHGWKLYAAQHGNFHVPDHEGWRAGDTTAPQRNSSTRADGVGTATRVTRSRRGAS